MPSKKKGTPTGKGFEADLDHSLDVAVDRGLIASWWPIPDGMKLIPMGGKQVLIPYIKTPADRGGYLHDATALLIEAKNHKGKSLPCEYEKPLNKKNERPGGLRWHQLIALIDISETGGIGLLVCQFPDAGVWALDGLGLRIWLNDGDAGENRASISLEHFRQYGTALGTIGNWEFSATEFPMRKRGVA